MLEDDQYLFMMIQANKREPKKAPFFKGLLPFQLNGTTGTCPINVLQTELADVLPCNGAIVNRNGLAGFVGVWIVFPKDHVLIKDRIVLHGKGTCGHCEYNGKCRNQKFEFSHRVTFK